MTGISVDLFSLGNYENWSGLIPSFYRYDLMAGFANNTKNKNSGRRRRQTVLLYERVEEGMMSRGGVMIY